jgi:hypothetical protein
MSILRYSILPALLFVFVFTSCSKKKDDVTPSFDRSNLIGKVWTQSQTDFILDGKSYTDKTYAGETKMEFKGNGTYITTDSDGESTEGKWELTGNKIKVTVQNETEYFTVSKLEAKTLSILALENLDLTKKEDQFTESEQIYLLAAAMFFTDKQIDFSKSKKLSVSISLTSN